jgi:hypothetical protein
MDSPAVISIAPTKTTIKAIPTFVTLRLPSESSLKLGTSVVEKLSDSSKKSPIGEKFLESSDPMDCPFRDSY